MKTLNGVLGPIDTRDIGYTLMHEHIQISDWSIKIAFEDWLAYNKFIELAVSKVNNAKKIGVKTIVDATPINSGRDIKLLRVIAKRTGIQIIASTGFYYDETAILKSLSTQFFLELLLREIEIGMQGTNTKAGIIKAATDLEGVTELNRKFLKAAALANIKTNIPIYTHASASNHAGLEQLNIFENTGVDLRNVVIGHCGDSNDIDYLEKLLRRGSYIGLDRFGQDDEFKIYNIEGRIDTFIELCKRGWIDKLIISHDFFILLHFFDKKWNKNNFVNTGMHPYGFGYFNKEVIPRLLDKGITRDQIETVTIINPRRFFEQGVKKKNE